MGLREVKIKRFFEGSVDDAQGHWLDLHIEGEPGVCCFKTSPALYTDLEEIYGDVRRYGSFCSVFLKTLKTLNVDIVSAVVGGEAPGGGWLGTLNLRQGDSAHAVTMVPSVALVLAHLSRAKTYISEDAYYSIKTGRRGGTSVAETPKQKPN